MSLIKKTSLKNKINNFWQMVNPRNQVEIILKEFWQNL